MLAGSQLKERPCVSCTDCSMKWISRTIGEDYGELLRPMATSSGSVESMRGHMRCSRCGWSRDDGHRDYVQLPYSTLFILEISGVGKWYHHMQQYYQSMCMLCRS